MLNPLSKRNKGVARSKQKNQEQWRVETNDEIFCRICMIKYTIGDYKQHMNVHRRQKKLPIASYHQSDHNVSRQAQMDKDSLYTTHEADINHVARLKGLFFASLVQSRAQRSENHERNQIQGMDQEFNQFSFALGKMRNIPLNQSQVLPLSKRSQLPSQNPQFKDAKGSIIDLLKTQRGMKHSGSPTTPQGHRKKCPSLYESLMESLSEHKTNSLNKIAHDKQ